MVLKQPSRRGDVSANQAPHRDFPGRSSARDHQGYGKPGQAAVPDELDELSEDLMETVSLGTRRFDNLLKKVS